MQVYTESTPGQGILLGSIALTQQGVDLTTLLCNRALGQLGHPSTVKGLGWLSLPSFCRMHSTCAHQMRNSRLQLKMACQHHQARQLMAQQGPALAALQSESAYTAHCAKSTQLLNSNSCFVLQWSPCFASGFPVHLCRLTIALQPCTPIPKTTLHVDIDLPHTLPSVPNAS